MELEIDYCPDCRGIWLDRGELDKIIERSVQQEPMPPRNTYHDKEHYRSEKIIIIKEERLLGDYLILKFITK